MCANLARDWQLEVQHNSRELPGPGFLEFFFFLGPVPSSPSDWDDCSTLIFEPMGSQSQDTVKEYHSLNGYLKHRYGKEVKDDDVVSLLRKDLSWRVKKVRSTLLRLAESHTNTAPQ